MISEKFKQITLIEGMLWNILSDLGRLHSEFIFHVQLYSTKNIKHIHYSDPLSHSTHNIPTASGIHPLVHLFCI